MTYTVNGKQYLVIAAGGPREAGDQARGLRAGVHAAVNCSLG